VVNVEVPDMSVERVFLGGAIIALCALERTNFEMGGEHVFVDQTAVDESLVAIMALMRPHLLTADRHSVLHLLVLVQVRLGRRRVTALVALQLKRILLQ
jgi:hypothetical protein